MGARARSPVEAAYFVAGERVVRKRRRLGAIRLRPEAGHGTCQQERQMEIQMPTRRLPGLLAAMTLGVTVLASAPCLAQDLEPRAYAASPAGAFFVVAGLSRSTGSVLTDPTLPVQNVDATIYGRAAGGRVHLRTVRQAGAGDRGRAAAAQRRQRRGG